MIPDKETLMISEGSNTNFDPESLLENKSLSSASPDEESFSPEKIAKNINQTFIKISFYCEEEDSSTKVEIAGFLNSWKQKRNNSLTNLKNVIKLTAVGSVIYNLLSLEMPIYRWLIDSFVISSEGSEVLISSLKNYSISGIKVIEVPGTSLVSCRIVLEAS